MKGMPNNARRKGSRRERVETAWEYNKRQSHVLGIDDPYILRLAIEPDESAFARVQVLRGGNGSREE